jgi:hypothetical protein
MPGLARSSSVSSGCTFTISGLSANSDTGVSVKATIKHNQAVHVFMVASGNRSPFRKSSMPPVMAISLFLYATTSFELYNSFFAPYPVFARAVADADVCSEQHL